MELREGYKNTEIGVIPEDWKKANISETSTLKARIGWQGLTTAEYLNAGNYHLVTGTDFKNGRIKWSTCHYVEKIRYTQDKNIQLQNGDILITKDGTIGKVAFVTNLILPATLNSGVFVIRSKRNSYSPIFVFYIFNSIYFSKFLRELVAGSTINHLYQKDFVGFDFPLPPTIEEQTAIATVLSDTDKLLQALEKKIAKKRLIKQGAMQELLKPKEGWVVKTLGDCINGSPTYGINASASKYDMDLPVYIRITDISDNGVFIAKNKVSVNHIDSFKYYLNENDLVFARTGASVGKSYLYNPKDGELVYAGFLIRININIKILNSKYFKFYTQAKKYWDWVSVMSMRSGQPGINGHEFSQLKLQLPLLQEQTQIATILSDMDTEIETLEKQLAKYKQVKQGLMQNLLTGKIRLV